MKKFIAILFFAISFSSFSQDVGFEKPNYKKIQKDIKKEGSEFQYSQLMDRYLSADTTMSLQQLRHLYYGYTFQPAYDPYGHSDYLDSLMPLLNKEILMVEDYKKINRFSDSLLVQDPFDLNALNYKLFSADKLLENEVFENAMAKTKMVVNTLMSSGDGLKKETAFYVISTAHEYQLLNFLRFNFGGQQSLVEHYDVLTLAENKFGIEAFYFDVSPCLNHLDSLFKN